MDYAGLGSFIVALVPVLVGLMLFLYNSWQSVKIKAELVEKLQEAVNKNNQYAIRHLFTLMYDKILSLDDILILLHDERSPAIVAALDSTIKRISYQNGRIEYAGLFRKKWLRKLFRFVLIAAATIFALFFVVSFVTICTPKNATVHNYVEMLILGTTLLLLGTIIQGDSSIKTLFGNQEFLILGSTSAANPTAPQTLASPQTPHQTPTTADP